MFYSIKDWRMKERDWSTLDFILDFQYPPPVNCLAQSATANTLILKTGTAREQVFLVWGSHCQSQALWLWQQGGCLKNSCQLLMKESSSYQSTQQSPPRPSSTLTSSNLEYSQVDLIARTLSTASTLGRVRRDSLALRDPPETRQVLERT